MNKEVMLSICVVTMNREKQLLEALNSCLSCELPLNTEFVVIDNASTDGTEQAVCSLFSQIDFPLVYVRNDQNIGAGAGRNLYFEKSSGKYIYGMDDDAVISPDNPDFFSKAVDIMEEFNEIAILTTQIYDMAWEKDRQKITGREYAKDLFYCKMFSGGSHFLRKNAFTLAPYFPNKYGYEELPPSLYVWDDGFINVFCPTLHAIHKPLIDKWNYEDVQNLSLLINECAIPYAIKKMVYPRLFAPVLYLGYISRKRKYLSKVPEGKELSDSLVKKTLEAYRLNEKIKIRTALKLIKEFGFSVL